MSNNNTLASKINTDCSFLEEGPNSDLLINLYEKGMYDTQNPNHVKGTVILTEAKKEKWNLSDYHHLVYANNIKNYHSFCFLKSIRYPELVKEGGYDALSRGEISKS